MIASLLLLSHPPRSMIAAAVGGAAAASSLSLVRPRLKPPLPILHLSNPKQVYRRQSGVCRADLVQDAPYAAAIGGCILSSIVVPSPGGPDDEKEEGGGVINSTDARFAVMGIISFIPYFNWMSWVFAWLDSGKQRYLVYSAAYLLPYLRTNLSINPEDSWLPVASILLCIIHVQLEASIRNGDLNDIQILVEAQKLFAPLSRRKKSEPEGYRGFPSKEMSKEQMGLPSVEELREEFQNRVIPRESTEELREEFQNRVIPREAVDERHHLNDKQDLDAREEERD